MWSWTSLEAMEALGLEDNCPPKFNIQNMEDEEDLPWDKEHAERTSKIWKQLYSNFLWSRGLSRRTTLPAMQTLHSSKASRELNFPLAWFTQPYDGSTDPDRHMAHYKQRMFAIIVPEKVQETCMCRGFGMSLIGPALKWYMSIPVKSISTFTELHDLFVSQFASSKRLEKTAADLYRLHIKWGETLRSFVGRFNKERLEIDHPDEATCINAFRKWLWTWMPLYEELTKCQPKTWAEVMRRALAEMRLEEDIINRDNDSPESESSHIDKKRRTKERSDRPPKAESYSNSKDLPREIGKVYLIQQTSTSSYWGTRAETVIEGVG